jgi:1-acyl-sn-glycerol-3-phosphate acyltransferase
MIQLAWRAVALVVLVLAGLLTLLLLVRFLPVRRQAAVRRAWSRLLLWLCGMRIAPNKPPATSDAEGLATIIVMNHVSWIDIFVLNAVAPSTFIAKSEIRRWPVLGALVAASGTMFIERGSRQAVRRTNQEIIRRIRQGERVAFFPEGTTSDGREPLHFHASLFAVAAPDATAGIEVVVQPAVVCYFHRGIPTEIPAYIGGQTLLHSLVSILSVSGLEARLEFLEPLRDLPANTSRHQIAAEARAQIASALQRLRHRDAADL